MNFFFNFGAFFANLVFLQKKQKKKKNEICKKICPNFKDKFLQMLRIRLDQHTLGKSGTKIVLFQEFERM